MAAHSRKSASGSSRWLNCPGSIKLVERAREEGLIPKESPPTVWSREGTACHRVMEFCFKNKEEPETYTGRKVSGVLITKELTKHCRKAYDEVQAILAEYPKARVWLERREVMKKEYPNDDVGGTCDVVLYDRKSGLLWIIDYKFGQKAVSAEDNTQLFIYVLAMYRKMSRHRNITNIRMSILQPKLIPALKTAELTPHEIESWDRFVLAKGIKLCDVEPPILIAGPHCEWCDARNVCGENNKQMTEVMRADFADITKGESPEVNLIPVKTLTDDQIGAVLANKAKLQKWLNEVEELAVKEYEAGVDIPHCKPVAKRATTVWNEDAKKIKAKLRRKRIPLDVIESEPTMKSPAQLRDALKAHYGDDDKAMAVWNGLVTKVENGYTIVPETDSRKRLEQSRQEDFRHLKGGGARRRKRKAKKARK